MSQRVGVAFHGVAEGKTPDVLSVGEGPGYDRIGVALFDKTGSQIPLNAPRAAWTQLHTGPTTLHFVAKYRATGVRSPEEPRMLRPGSPDLPVIQRRKQEITVRKRESEKRLAARRRDALLAGLTDDSRHRIYRSRRGRRGAGRDRVIYPAGQKQVQLAVTNNDDKAPI